MDLLSQGRLDEASEAWTQALAIDAAATDVAQLQHGLLNQLGRADEASALLQGTVDYLRQNRTPREAAEFFIGCLGTLELPVDPALALADLWAEAEETDRALEVLGHGLERAKSEKNIPGQVRIAERWIELDSHSIEIIAILAQHGAEVSAGQEHRDLLVGLGEKRIEESDWDSAAEIFRKLFEAHPDDAQIQDRLIRCHEGRGHPDEANRLRIAIAQEHLSCERWSQCQETLAPLVTDETTDADVLKMVFRCHVEMLDGKKASEIGHRLVDQAEAADDLQTAIDLAAEVSQLRPKDTGWARRLLDLQAKAGRADEAIATGLGVLGRLAEERHAVAVAEVLDLLLTLAPNDRTVRADAIQALTALEDHEGAKRQRLTLAALHRDAGDPAAAEAIYRHILDTDATCAEASEGLLELHLAQGNTEAAVAFLWERAAALADGDQADDAVRTLRRLLELDGHHTEARRRLADLLRSQMRNDEAVEELATLAQQLTQSGDLADALTTWEEVTALRPEEIPHHQALIACQLSAGGGHRVAERVDALMKLLLARSSTQEALESLDRFQELDPDLPLWHRWRAEIYTTMGDSDKAIEAFRRFSAQVESQPPAAAAPEIIAGADSVDLFPDHTFETFVTGERNNFAFATCKAVAENPAKAYNPLFLYSDVGLGKTHLINAIGHHALAHHPELRLLFISMEDFISGLFEAIENHRIADFRARHRHVDLLLIDDVQVLAGKERAQEEFFHLFNALHQARRQIVISSDRPPRELTHLEKRLRSRFGAGVIVDIQPPDQETRLEILRRMAPSDGEVALSEEVIRLVAERCTSNVRELKGAVTQLVAMTSTRSQPLSSQEAAGVLDQLVGPSEQD
jgi:chromosomal replication initiation ATPase DnaA